MSKTCRALPKLKKKSVNQVKNKKAVNSKRVFTKEGTGVAIKHRKDGNHHSHLRNPILKTILK